MQSWRAAGIGVLILEATVGAALPAQASVTFRFSGTVGPDSFDLGDGFVTPGGSMDGLPFTMAITVLASPGLFTPVDPGPPLPEAGARQAAFGFFGGFSFDINGVMRTGTATWRLGLYTPGVSGNPARLRFSFANVPAYGLPGLSSLGLYGGALYRQITFQIALPGRTIDVTDPRNLPHSVALGTADGLGSAYSVLGEIGVIGSQTVPGGTGVNAPLQIAAFNLQVPEPASWLMLVTGFGLTGAIRRWRRPVQATSGTGATIGRPLPA